MEVKPCKLQTIYTLETNKTMKTHSLMIVFILVSNQGAMASEMIGYKGRACDKLHPEYLWGYRDRGSKLILNMVDANSSLFFDKNMINEALDFIEEELFKGKNVLICCNKGESRSASLGLLFLIRQGHIKGETLTDCEAVLKYIL